MYVPSAVALDGANDYYTRGADLTGHADGKVLTISFWFMLTGGDGGNVMFCRNAAGYFAFYRSTANKVFGLAKNAAAANIFFVGTSTTLYTADNAWHHLMSSADLVAGSTHFYIDGADVSEATPTATNDTIDFTRANFSIGATEGGTQDYSGRMTELYYTQEYVDLSVAANRYKFLTIAGKPADLGTDGSTPTGNQPILYMKFAEGALGTNSGSGGNFTATGTPASTIGPVTPRQARARR